MDSDKLIVHDVELGDDAEIPFDNIVLNIGLIPSEDTDEVSKILRLSKDQEGFLMEAHPKLGPVDTMTPGIFIAGAARGPKNVAETIAEGYAAASRALMMLAQGYVTKEPFIPKFDWAKCTKCVYASRLAHTAPLGVCRVSGLSTYRLPARAVVHVWLSVRRMP
ncbi:hypothetical protein [Vulcanisaeta sp. JCM 14467]|uniref:hypothetical protein n=1 Tax=Vulcanisaeta sp. JCM 14467 TaxID=1295370 RepID=UPI000A8D0D56|nr:hypothetical protein [Vulcanisaeta sp. JCM 14467]